MSQSPANKKLPAAGSTDEEGKEGADVIEGALDDGEESDDYEFDGEVRISIIFLFLEAKRSPRMVTRMMKRTTRTTTRMKTR